MPRTTIIYRLAAIATMLAAVGGCRLLRQDARRAAGGPAAPAVLQPGASAAEIVAAVNANSSRIQSIQAPSATFTVPEAPGLPLLRGSIVMERPQRLRLLAGTAITGGEVDLGSNDERWWLWVKRSEPPAVYTTRHDQHATGAARQLLPVEPRWVLDALGLVTLDPAAVYQGPFPRPDGTLELRNASTGPSGPIERVTVIDPTRAWVVEQHVYDASGALLASAVAERFRYHPQAMASLPERVTIRVPAAQLALAINTGRPMVNAPVANPDGHWAMPAFDSVPLVDLGASPTMPAVPAPALEQPGYQQFSYENQTMVPVAQQPENLVQEPLTPAAPRVVIQPSEPAPAVVHRLPSGGVELR